jgi:hypothetical protein
LAQEKKRINKMERKILGKILGWYLIAVAVLALVFTMFETDWTAVFTGLSVAPSSIVSEGGTMSMLIQLLLFPYTIVSLFCMSIANAYLSNFGLGVNYLFSWILPAIIVLVIGILILRQSLRRKKRET